MATKSTQVKKYKAKLYFGCNDEEDDFIKDLLIKFKSVNGSLKSFNSYTYNGLVYFNLYLNDAINTEQEFKNITKTFNKLFQNDYQFKYKNEYNTLLFSTKNNEYKKPTEKYLFVDDDN